MFKLNVFYGKGLHYEGGGNIVKKELRFFRLLLFQWNFI